VEEGAAGGRQPWVAKTLGGGGAAMGGSDEWGHCVIEKDCAEIERNFVYWYCYCCLLFHCLDYNLLESSFACTVMSKPVCILMQSALLITLAVSV
jgi:hypothetical protein